MSSTANQPLVFILDNVADYQSTADGLYANYEVHILSADGDALAQMVMLLDGRTGLDAIHLVSHGDVGVLDLGTLSLSSANLADHSASLSTLGTSLSPDADFLLYGCDVAQGDAGMAFVDALSVATGADVAASDDVTGPAALGSNAVLEYQVGDIEVEALAETSLQSNLGLIDVVTGLLSYVFNGSDFQLQIDADITNADFDNALDVGSKTDRFVLSSIADGAEVSVFLDTSMADSSIQIIREGVLGAETLANSVDGSSTNAFLSWVYQAGDIVQATTTERGTYSLFLGTDTGLAPVANILASVFVDQAINSIVEDAVGLGWTHGGGSLTGTLTLNNSGLLGDLSGLSFELVGPSFADDGGNVTAVGQFGTLYLNPHSGYYEYAPNASAIDALGDGENGSDTFTFNAAGVVGDIASGSFSFNITGSNDAPVITLDGQGATLVEASGAGNATEGKGIAHIGVLISDPEGGAQMDAAALATDGWVLVPETSLMTHDASYGTAQLDLTTGQVSYTLNNELEATQLLNVGDHFTETFFVSVVDGAGLTDRVAVSFEVSGADDALRLAIDEAIPAATYIDGNGVSQTNYSRTGLLNVSDLDTPLSSYVGLSFGLQGGYGDDGGNFGLTGQAGSFYVNAESGQFDYVGNAAKIEALAPGETITERFTFLVSDAYGLLDTGVYEVEFVGVAPAEA